MTLSIERRKELILANTEVVTPTLVPGIRLRLTTSRCPLWSFGEEELRASPFPEPYWAFAWAGGQGLARYLLDSPQTVRGKRVLDLATGSGLVAVGAAKAGAARVTANDVDPFCEAAVALNAAENGVSVDFLEGDLLGTPPGDYDVIVAGDICYEQGLSYRVRAWLFGHAAAGALVLIGDPGRATFSPVGLVEVARYRPEVVGECDDGDVRRARVFRVGCRGQEVQCNQ